MSRDLFSRIGALQREALANLADAFRDAAKVAKNCAWSASALRLLVWRLREPGSAEEIRHAQIAGTLDVAAIVQPSLTLARVERGSEGTPLDGTILPPIEVTATYQATLDFTLITDPISYWEDTLRDGFISAARAIMGASEIALEEDNPSAADRDQNRISGTMRLVGYRTTGQASIVAYEVEVEIEDNPGNVLAPVWAENALAKIRERGPGDRFMRVREKITSLHFSGLYDVAMTRLSGSAGSARIIPTSEIEAPPGTDGWVRLTESETRRPRRRGIEPHTVDLMEIERMTPYQWGAAPPAGERGLGTRTISS